MLSAAESRRCLTRSRRAAKSAQPVPLAKKQRRANAQPKPAAGTKWGPGQEPPTDQEPPSSQELTGYLAVSEESVATNKKQRGPKAQTELSGESKVGPQERVCKRKGHRDPPDISPDSQTVCECKFEVVEWDDDFTCDISHAKIGSNIYASHGAHATVDTTRTQHTKGCPRGSTLRGGTPHFFHIWALVNSRQTRPEAFL